VLKIPDSGYKWRCDREVVPWIEKPNDVDIRIADKSFERGKLCRREAALGRPNQPGSRTDQPASTDGVGGVLDSLSPRPP
jgi:hypothetical protein